MAEKDFRAKLYESYVSSFKESNRTDSPQDVAEFQKWADHRYLPHLDVSRSASILEIGCGHGRMLRYLKANGFEEVIGIDVSKEQIDIAKTSGLRAEQADIFEYLHNHPVAFDVIIAIDVVEHFTKSELLEMLPMVHAALKPSGVVLIQTVNGEGLFSGQIMHGDLTHMTILNESSLTQLLKYSGFLEPRFSEAAPIASGFVGSLRADLWTVLKWLLNGLRQIENGKTQRLWTENMIASARKR
jgi:2-polyprenyl-3-methyl-5-hydroxy-6-metoxy-1,4-benzoquinol methylase